MDFETHKVVYNKLKNYFRNKIKLSFKTNHLYYNILILYVWPDIDSAPEHHTDMRLVSLELSGPDMSREKNFPEKWPLAKLSNKMLSALMIFYGNIS